MPAGAIGPLSERRPEAGDGGRRCWGNDRAAEGGGKGGRWHLPTPYFSSSVGLHMLLALRRPPAAGPLGRAGRAGAAHGAGAAAAPPPPPSPSAGAQLRGRRSAAPASGCPRPAGPGLRRPEVRGGGGGKIAPLPPARAQTAAAALHHSARRRPSRRPGSSPSAVPPISSAPSPAAAAPVATVVVVAAAEGLALPRPPADEALRARAARTAPPSVSLPSPPARPHEARGAGAALTGPGRASSAQGLTGTVSRCVVLQRKPVLKPTHELQFFQKAQKANRYPRGMGAEGARMVAAWISGLLTRSPFKHHKIHILLWCRAGFSHCSVVLLLLCNMSSPRGRVHPRPCCREGQRGVLCSCCSSGTPPRLLRGAEIKPGILTPPEQLLVRSVTQTHSFSVQGWPQEENNTLHTAFSETPRTKWLDDRS